MKNNSDSPWNNPQLAELLVEEGQGLGLDLKPGQIQQLLLFGRELEKNNRRLNLTAIVEVEEVIRKHIIDSLAALPFLPFKEGKLVDIGSGAGFPGLALKIACPELQVTLVESIKKKAAFLSQTVAKLGLVGIKVSDRRAEELGQDGAFREYFRLATARAVASLPVLLELALPLLEVGGYFIAYKGPEPEEEIDQSQRALILLGGKIKKVKKITLRGGEGRSLVIVKKLSSTPSPYPRRPGRPAKRPLLGPKEAGRNNLPVGE